ncbi:MAG: YggS family pyridoxal phosphate-dependent enzyme [Spirochaetales bacterium]|nr:YggS family pyridoxal phosphate-dependent enzyme [Spirochaetales bacterium]
MESFGYVKENYFSLRDELDSLGHSNVEILCVSKTFPWEAVQVLVDRGVHSFGENRAQELKTKFQAPRYQSLNLHFIGHLQTNKVTIASEMCSWVDSVDSVKVVRALQKSLAGTSKVLNLLIEVNTSGESQKSGVITDDEVNQVLEEIKGCKNLAPRGLMTIGPHTNDNKAIRQSFSRLSRLFENLGVHSPSTWDVLSIGMSNDYRIALDEGATMIRIGSLIFGNRA